jgi:hypothetical protein
VNPVALIEAIAQPLDAARRTALAAALRSRMVARVVGRREARVPLLAAAQITALLLITVACPVVLFALGPILLGVPHLASDVRYLIVRPRVSRAAVVIACAASVAVLGLRACEVAHVSLPNAMRLEIVVGCAWVIAASVLGSIEGHRWSPLVVAVGTVALGAVALQHPWHARVVLAQAHNVIGIGLWVWLYRRRSLGALLPVALAVGGAVLLASGATLGWTLRANALSAWSLDLWQIARAFAPHAPAAAAMAGLLVFVFLQAIHYAAWLIWIPQEELPCGGTFTFRMTGRALLRDFGAPGLALIAGLSAILAAAATLDLRQAVSVYMALAAFHAYLELAMVGYLIGHGRIG